MLLPVGWGARLVQAGLGGDPGAGSLLPQSWSPTESPCSPSGILLAALFRTLSSLTPQLR